MPKEITHFALADSIYSSLPADSDIRQAIKHHYHLFLTGSVTPDTPYFSIMGLHRKQVQNSNLAFHGTDRTSLIPVLQFLNRYNENHPDAVAYAAGVICHILTDTMYHPLVTYYSGLEGHHQGATLRHRQFETALDYYFWYRSENHRNNSLAYHLRSLEINKNQLVKFMGHLFDIRHEGARKSLYIALRIHMTLQYLCLEKWSSFLFRHLHDPFRCLPSVIEALFYPYPKPRKLFFFEDDIIYKDPCSGKKHRTTIAQMQQETVKNGVRFLAIVESYLSGHLSVLNVLDRPDLPAICPGQSCGTTRYWNGQHHLKQTLYSKK